MRKLKQLSENGISLIEVMVAMVIMSMSLLLLLNMSMVALDGNDWSNKTTVATQLLQEKLEQLRGMDNPVAGSDSAGGLTRSWTISDAGDYLTQVDVQINWDDIRGYPQTSTMSAYIRSDSI